MSYYLHPREEQRIRSAKLPVGGVPNFRCKCCGKVQFAFAGRKKAMGGGWNCAGCSK